MFIVRYSEIGLKGHKARDRMEQILVRNIGKGLAALGVEAEVKRGFGRIYVSGESDEDLTTDVLSRTMGIKHFSHAVIQKTSGLDSVVEEAVKLWKDSVSGKRFAVRARRTGSHDYRSTDVMKAVGDAIFPYSEGVDLTNPDIVLNVEIRENLAYFFTRIINGPGGLPLGSEGRLVALVSGGIDSPVAAWKVMKRGCPTDLIFISLAPPIDTIDFLNAASSLIKNWSHGYDPRIHIIDGKRLVETLTDTERFKLTNVTYKRIIYFIAQEIAIKSKAHGIVTGESLGQVSSQTPESLHATSHNLQVPMMRPLLGLDKDEIVDLARRIGTFPETSSGEFCSLFALNPITKPTVEDIEKDMQNFHELQELLETDVVIKGSQINEFMESLKMVNVQTTEVPDNAVVVDLRTPEKFEKWHYEGAVNAPLRNLEEMLSTGNGDRTYVFYCMKGLQSAFAASKAREMGLKAFYIREDALKKIESRNNVNQE